MEYSSVSTFVGRLRPAEALAAGPQNAPISPVKSAKWRSHAVENATEAAYWRGDLFDKRRKLMEAWAEFCIEKPSKDVIKLRG